MSYSRETTPTPESPNRRERRKSRLPWMFCCVAIFSVIVWIVLPQFFDVPLHISEKTTVITSPLTPDGRRIDYLAALEARFAPKCPPEENGFRDIAAALGRESFRMSQEEWEEICAKLDLDPNVPPTHNVLRPAQGILMEYWRNEQDRAAESGDMEAPTADDEATYQDRVYFSDWEVTELLNDWYLLRIPPLDNEPTLEAYVEVLNPLLDLVAEAVRKDVYYFPSGREGNSFNGFSSQYAENCHRTLAQALLFRANFSLNAGDSDAFWRDIISALRIGRWLQADIGTWRRHSGRDICIKTFQLAVSGLQRHNPSREQLHWILDELARLPVPKTVEEASLCMQFKFLDSISYLALLPPRNRSREMTIGPLSDMTGLNWNLVAETCNECFEQQNDIHNRNATPWEKSEEYRKAPGAGKFMSTPTGLDNLSFIMRDDRSRWLAKSHFKGDVFYGQLFAAESDARHQLLILALELEKVKLDTGRYPATVQSASERLSPEQLTNPFSLKPFCYRRNDAGNGCLLYSVGFNALDEGGRFDEKTASHWERPPINDDIVVRLGEPMPETDNQDE